MALTRGKTQEATRGTTPQRMRQARVLSTLMRKSSSHSSVDLLPNRGAWHCLPVLLQTAGKLGTTRVEDMQDRLQNMRIEKDQSKDLP